MNPQDNTNKTSILKQAERNTLVVPGLGRFGFQVTDEETTYHPIPLNFKTLDKPTRWRVHLKFGAPTPYTVVGLDIYGDVALGRGKDGIDPPDVDLTELDALKMGVSRRHAMLRPTPTKLFLLDLGSTNGTFLNAMPIGKGMAKPLRSGDTIALGDLGFVLEVISEPSQTTQATEPPTP